MYSCASHYSVLTMVVGGKGTINQSREASSLSDSGGRDGDDQERSCNETSLTIGNLNLCEKDKKIEKIFP